MTDQTMNGVGRTGQRHSQTPLSTETRDTSEVSFRNVLVPFEDVRALDGSLPTGLALARIFGATLHTFGVVDDHRDLDRASAVATAAAVSCHPAMTATSAAVVAADPAAAIAGRAEDLGATVVCLSTRRRGRTGRLLDGLSRRLMNLEQSALVAIGPRAEQPTWADDPNHRPTPLAEGRLVVCVDSPPESERAVAVAARWARALNRSLSVVTAIDEDADPLQRAGAMRRLTEPIARLHVATLTATIPKSVGVDFQVLRSNTGNVEAINEYIAERPTAMLVVTLPDRTGLRRLLSGGTATKIVQTATVPSLVIPT